MKGLIAALGVLITVGVVAVCAVVELLIKLAPLLVLAAGIWIAIKVWRSRRKRRENRAHVVTPWEWEHPAQGPTPIGGSGSGCARACDGSSRSGGFVAAGDRPPGPLLCGARARQRPAR